MAAHHALPEEKHEEGGGKSQASTGGRTSDCRSDESWRRGLRMLNCMSIMSDRIYATTCSKRRK